MNTPSIINDNVTNEMIELNIATRTIQSPAFNNMLVQISESQARANKLLTNYKANPEKFIAETDDEEIDSLIKEITEITKVSKKVDATKTEMRKRMDAVKNRIMQEFDEKIKEYNFDSLTHAKNDLNQLKKDMSNLRSNQRWLELEEEFNSSIQVYPIITRLAPRLTEFNLFKLRYPNLVSGAKSRKLKKTDFQKVRTIVDQYANDLKLIESNDWQLDKTFWAELLKFYIENPETSTISNHANSLKEKQTQQEIMIRKKAEELKRKEELQKQKEAEYQQKIEEQKRQIEQQQAQQAKAQTQVQQPANNPENTQQTQPTQAQATVQQQPTKFGYTIQYLTGHPLYKNLHFDPQVKLAALYEIINLAANPQTQSYVTADTNNNPLETLALIDYILHA